MNILTMPDNLVLLNQQSIQFQLTPLGQRTTPALSGADKVSAPYDNRYRVDITQANRGLSNPEPFKDNDPDRFKKLKKPGWDDMETFVNQTQGTYLPFYMWDPLREYPRGKASGFGKNRDAISFNDEVDFDSGGAATAGEINGYIKDEAPKGASEIVIKGLVPNQELSIAKGDKFSIYHGIYQIETMYQSMFSVASNAQGEATVYIAPRLYYPILPDNIVNFFRPKNPFRFLELPRIPVEGAFRSTIRFSAISAIELLWQEESQ